VCDCIYINNTVLLYCHNAIQKIMTILPSISKRYFNKFMALRTSFTDSHCSIGLNIDILINYLHCRHYMCSLRVIFEYLVYLVWTWSYWVH